MVGPQRCTLVRKLFAFNSRVVTNQKLDEFFSFIHNFCICRIYYIAHFMQTQCTKRNSPSRVGGKICYQVRTTSLLRILVQSLGTQHLRRQKIVGNHTCALFMKLFYQIPNDFVTAAFWLISGMGQARIRDSVCLPYAISAIYIRTFHFPQVCKTCFKYEVRRQIFFSWPSDSQKDCCQ